ncbi:MAG: RtcB family protein [Balneola sp.]|nr:MAG: RtcB family protein [Balneola sp.]
MENLKIFGEEIIEPSSIEQIKNCFSEDDHAVLTADAHYGYGHPIGGAVAYRNKISLSGVGFDIACGNKAVRTPVQASDVNIAKVMDEIWKQIGFGAGVPNPNPIDHPVLDEIPDLQVKMTNHIQNKLQSKAAKQLGSVGSGNHFVDLFRDTEGFLWIGVHFGSRGFGHNITTGFIALSQGKGFGEHANEGPMNGKPILFDTHSEIGMDYIQALEIAGRYAYAGRDAVVNKVLEILGTESNYEVHNHHNFAWKEQHFGEEYWVVRKGCTPAFPGQAGFIGANMFDDSVIIEGVDSKESQKGLYSTVHGAGRVMSRRKAAGKFKWKHGRKIQVQRGEVNYKNTQRDAVKRGIELRGGGADESPQCYKKLEEVLSFHQDTIRITHTLTPIGVAMASDGKHILILISI